jgi:hypothetical protein
MFQGSIQGAVWVRGRWAAERYPLQSPGLVPPDWSPHQARQPFPVSLTTWFPYLCGLLGAKAQAPSTLGAKVSFSLL